MHTYQVKFRAYSNVYMYLAVPKFNIFCNTFSPKEKIVTLQLHNSAIKNLHENFVFQELKVTVYKPCRQVRRKGGVAQMFTKLNKSCLLKVSTKGGGGQKWSKFCLRGVRSTIYIGAQSGHYLGLAGIYQLLEKRSVGSRPFDMRNDKSKCVAM